MLVTAPQSARAQNYTVLYNFTGFADGGNPYGGVILDGQGNSYGTTVAGGATGNGTVFKIDSAGVETVLHSFAGGSDGRSPIGSLVLDRKGHLYGTTYYGGPDDSGTIFEVNSVTGAEKVLYSFTGGSDGKWPIGIFRDSQGNLYGGTQIGGSHFAGVIYKLSPSGQQTVLYSFTGVNGDGSNPQAALISDNAGNLYGTTFSGGGTGCGSGCGTVFKLSRDGTETVLYSFKGGSDGADPFSALIRDASGNLYGDTYVGGHDTCPAGGCGIVYKIDSAGNETILHSFTGGSDGGSPYLATLVRDSHGNLYGTTSVGGDLTCNPTVGCGTVFKISPTGVETVLHRFTGIDGINPYSGVVSDSKGDIYGTTYTGGASNQGVVFEITH
jgi:uncharacterized repeat protein (TIGR03803 family)